MKTKLGVYTPPEGYRIRETDEQVGVNGTRYTRWGARELARRYPPTIPSYHLRVERLTRNPFTFNRWAVVAYQNVLERIDPEE
jgi:hypothetical protein